MMAMTTLPAMLLALIAAWTALYLLRTVAAFLRNRYLAKKMGLPIIYGAVQRFNPVWMILKIFLVPILLKLPYGLGSWSKYTRQQWIWDDRGETFDKLGKAFVYVTPGEMMIHTIDLDATRQMFARKRDFEKDEIDKRLPVLITPSVSSTTFGEWQRQRRITSRSFNERNMVIVWNESLRQSVDLCQWWSSSGEQGLKTSMQGFMALPLNVLAAAGLGLKWEFAPIGQKADGELEYATMYRESLTPLITNIILLGLTPRWLYKYGPRFASFLPQSLGEHVVKAQTFRRLVRQLLEERKAQIKAGEPMENNFLNSVITNTIDQSEESSEKGLEESSPQRGGLTEEEVFGNLTNYNIAGHETTGHTLTYTCYVLSVEPKWQDWLQEELDHVFPDLPMDPKTADYTQAFPKLKRCLVLMYEMLRLYPPVPMHAKHTYDQTGRGQEMRIDGRTVYVPRKTVINVAAYAIHLSPEYWGPDSHEFKPTRWIQSRDDKAGDHEAPLAKILESEVIASPPIAKESFLPWSSGARDCPGQKFSQVEYVAVIAYILRNYRIEAVPLEGETLEDTRKRIIDYTMDSVLQVTLSFREPNKYALRLVKRLET